MSNDWVKIHSLQEEHIAQIILAVLEENKIKAFKINKKDSMHTHLVNGEIELYVDPNEVIRAKHIISKHIS